MVTNSSSHLSAAQDQHIFDIPQVRALLIVLYTIIFIFCCIGNLAVVLVVIFHSRMRNMTKFLLGNLAFANLCVGIFCVYQSLTTYLYESWFYGDFMCRMHHFTQSLCHTASVLILVAIAVERYLVLLHPFKSRQMMTLRKLVALITILWISSAAIAAPRLYYFGTIKISIRKHQKETICIPKKKLYDSATADTIYFALLYVFPLTIISVLYAKIAKHLHRSVELRKGLAETEQGEREGHSCSYRHPESSVQCGGRESASFQAVLRKSKSDNGGVFCCRNRNSLSFSSSTSTSIKNSLSDTENRPSKANVRVPWRRSVCIAKPKYRTDTEMTLASPSVVQRKTLKLLQYKDENLTLKKFQFVSQRRSSWPCCHSESHMSRSSSNPLLSAHNYLPRKDGHIHGAENFGKAVKVKRTSETLISSTNGHGTLRQLQSNNAARIQLNQRLHAIRVLIVIVVTFAVLNLPFHVRKLCLNYLPSYDADSDVNHLLTPLTFLLMYANCAISPLLYAFLSKKFRQSFLDLIFMRRRRRNAGHAGVIQ